MYCVIVTVDRFIIHMHVYRQKLTQVLDHDSSGVSKHLGQIADSMYEWKGRLAEELGLTKADVAAIEMKHPTDLKLQT